MGDFLAEKLLGILDGGYPPGSFIEGFERDMFYEVETVQLDQVGLCAKLDGFGFLAPDYGADVVLVDTHDPARHRFPGLVHLVLLGKHPLIMLRLL